MIQFVANYDDLSTDKGYQFRFRCDKCSNGYMTRFQASKVGMASSVLRTAGSIFGGWVSSAGYSTYELQRLVGGPEHDAALREAMDEGKAYFHQCTRCGRWVCPEVCWNGKANLCEGCAPNLQEEISAVQAQAKTDVMRGQVHELAAKQNYAEGVDVSKDNYIAAPSIEERASSTPVCGHCGADVNPSAKFCGQCGKAANVPKAAKFCTQCGHQAEGDVKFCPECGKPLGK